MGETLKITLIKWATDGTETRKTVRVKIVGVINEMRDEPDWSIYMPLSDMESYLTRMATWICGRGGIVRAAQSLSARRYRTF